MWHTWRLPSLKIMSLFGSWVHWTRLWLSWITTQNCTELVRLFAIFLFTALPKGHLYQSFEELQMISAGILLFLHEWEELFGVRASWLSKGWVLVWAAWSNTSPVMCTLLQCGTHLGAFMSVHTAFLIGKGRTKEIIRRSNKILFVVLHIYLIAKFSVGSSRNSGVKTAQDCSKHWRLNEWKAESK